MKILTVVGARPQFIKAAMVSRAILKHNRREDFPKITEEIIHTGQHYDTNMSRLFFEEMRIPEPAAHLSVGSASHGEATGRMLQRIEKEILNRGPDWVIVYGDTNSTLAGGLAAAKLQIPVAHVEAGLRSFNKKMPEEVNRVLTDHLSTLLFCPTSQAVQNLAAEGLVEGVHQVGDVMRDAALAFGKIAAVHSDVLPRLGLNPGQYYLATVHRAENTDSRVRLSEILQGLSELSRMLPVVLPLHPRTRKRIQELKLEQLCGNLLLIEPLAYADMLRLEKSAKLILTDSGGVQKEAYFSQVPCVTFRDETEWVETVEAGWNQVVGAEAERIVAAALKASPGRPIQDYGSGGSDARIVEILIRSSPLHKGGLGFRI